MFLFFLGVRYMDGPMRATIGEVKLGKGSERIPKRLSMSDMKEEWEVTEGREWQIRGWI